MWAIAAKVVAGVGGHAAGVWRGVPGRDRGATAVGYLEVEGGVR